MWHTVLGNVLGMDREELSMMIAANIESAMQRKGMNPAEVARRAKINPSGVYDILSGRSRSPRLDTIHKIAQALVVPVASLFEEKRTSELRSAIIDAIEALPEGERQRILKTARAWASEA
jgi:transcriptional regulator with XRE-family HTH domain